MTPVTPDEGATPRLTVVGWGAVRSPAHAEGAGSAADHAAEGAAAPLSAIPAGLRRRLGGFERAIVQTIIGLAAPDEAAHVTLGSRYGNLTSTAAILDSLSRGEPPSPTQFSHSVLNAACGVANQVRKDRTSHTAVSAGRRTLHGALTEAWLHMRERPGLAHILVAADAPFPEPYRPLETGWRAGLAIGMRLAATAPGDPARISAPDRPRAPLGNAGYLTTLDLLRDGRRTLVMNGADWAAI